MDFVLGLDLHLSVPTAREAQATATEQGDLPPGAAELLDARRRARADRDYAEADRLRDELRSLGIELTDRPDGSSDWRRS
jgi:cysteinyl-tRNA synthetase